MYLFNQILLYKTVNTNWVKYQHPSQLPICVGHMESQLLVETLVIFYKRFCRDYWLWLSLLSFFLLKVLSSRFFPNPMGPVNFLLVEEHKNYTSFKGKPVCPWKDLRLYLLKQLISSIIKVLKIHTFWILLICCKCTWM